MARGRRPSAGPPHDEPPPPRQPYPAGLRRHRHLVAGRMAPGLCAKRHRRRSRARGAGDAGADHRQRRPPDGHRPGQGLQRPPQRHRHQDRHAAVGNRAVGDRDHPRPAGGPGRHQPAGRAQLRGWRAFRRLRPGFAQRRLPHPWRQCRRVPGRPAQELRLLHQQHPHRPVHAGAHRRAARPGGHAVRPGLHRRRGQHGEQAPAGRGAGRSGPADRQLPPPAGAGRPHRPADRRRPVAVPAGGGGA